MGIYVLWAFLYYVQFRREATREEKQLYFGFLLNRLDIPPPLVSLDVFDEPFFSLISSGQKFLKKLDFGQPPPPFFLENFQTLASKVSHKVWI